MILLAIKKTLMKVYVMMAAMIALCMAGTKTASSDVTKAVVSASSMALSTAGEKAAPMVDSPGKPRGLHEFIRDCF